MKDTALLMLGCAGLGASLYYSEKLSKKYFIAANVFSVVMISSASASIIVENSKTKEIPLIIQK